MNKYLTTAVVAQNNAKAATIAACTGNATITIDVKKNGSNVGTITISTGGTNSGTAQYTLTVNGGSPSSPAAPGRSGAGETR